MIEVENGDYAAAIVQALGAGGASVRITTTAGKASVAVTGQASGPTKAVANEPVRQQDTFMLSSEAQALISDAAVALTIISSASMTGEKYNSPKSTGTPADGAAGVSPSEPKQSADAEAVVAPAAVSSFASIGDIVAAAQASASDPNTVYASLGSQLDLITSSMGADEKSSFMAAVTNRTLSIQNTSDIPGVEAPETAVITGSGMALLGGAYSSAAAAAASGQAVMAAIAKGGGYGFMSFDAFGGSQLITWGQPPSAA